jgi:hypothetical protein
MEYDTLENEFQSRLSVRNHELDPAYVLSWQFMYQNHANLFEGCKLLLLCRRRTLETHARVSARYRAFPFLSPCAFETDLTMGNAAGKTQIGYRVLGVQPDSPAAKIGLVSFFDFIVAANGVPFTDMVLPPSSFAPRCRSALLLLLRPPFHCLAALKTPNATCESQVVVFYHIHSFLTLTRILTLLPPPYTCTRPLSTYTHTHTQTHIPHSLGRHLHHADQGE